MGVCVCVYNSVEYATRYIIEHGKLLRKQRNIVKKTKKHNPITGACANNTLQATKPPHNKNTY